MPNRYQSSTALIVDDQPYLIDCGSGSPQRQMDARAMGRTAFDFPKLTRLFVSHLGDQQVFEAVPRMAGQNFSYMLQEVPGCFMGLRRPAQSGRVLKIINIFFY
ncbi:MAG: hypothetical protein ACPGWR_18210 [Ardenticatenaceae bacterium]